LVGLLVSGPVDRWGKEIQKESPTLWVKVWGGFILRVSTDPKNKIPFGALGVNGAKL